MEEVLAGRSQASGWIFSDPFPQPAAGVIDKENGTLPAAGPGANPTGWVRLRAAGDPAKSTTWDDYPYVPE
jgi:hypothetical protein